MKLIMLGAPGAGKGTQAAILSEKFSIPAISTGAIIRETIENETPFGLKVKSYMDKGLLVPDEAVIEIFLNRIAKDDCKNGYILDGFPRTVNQAKAMEESGIEIDTALSLEVDDSVIVKRLSGRRECSSCRTPYHISSKPPKAEGVCDKCGAELITRADDNPETIANRLSVYHEQTAPVKDYYKAKGKLIEVEFRDAIEKTTQLILEKLEKLC